MPLIVDDPFTVDEPLLLRHLLPQAIAYSHNALADEVLFVLDVETTEQTVDICRGALGKVRGMLGSNRPLVRTEN